MLIGHGLSRVESRVRLVAVPRGTARARNARSTLGCRLLVHLSVGKAVGSELLRFVGRPFASSTVAGGLCLVAESSALSFKGGVSSLNSVGLGIGELVHGTKELRCFGRVVDDEVVDVIVVDDVCDVAVCLLAHLSTARLLVILAVGH